MVCVICCILVLLESLIHLLIIPIIIPINSVLLCFSYFPSSHSLSTHITLCWFIRRLCPRASFWETCSTHKSYWNIKTFARRKRNWTIGWFEWI